MTSETTRPLLPLNPQWFAFSSPGLHILRLNQGTSKNCKLFRICMCEYVAGHIESMWFDRLLGEMLKILGSTSYFLCLALHSLTPSHQLACREHEIMLFSSSCACCCHAVILLPLKQVTTHLWKCFLLMPLYQSLERNEWSLKCYHQISCLCISKKQCICPNFTTCLGRIFSAVKIMFPALLTVGFIGNWSGFFLMQEIKAKKKIVRNWNKNLIINR